MLGVGFCVVVALLTLIYYGRWVIHWRNPKCNGVLPPGSMGLPLIGETLQLLVPSRPFDIHPFFKKRIQRYGTVFKTSLAGRPMVVSVDNEFNRFIAGQEGRLVELWYLDSLSKILSLGGESSIAKVGVIHKYVRNTVLNYYGSEKLKESLLPPLQNLAEETLRSWSTKPSVELKQAVSVALLNFTAKNIFCSEELTSINANDLGSLLSSFMSFPMNIPGTTYHKSLKCRKKLFEALEVVVKKRLNNSFGDMPGGGLLDQLNKDMNSDSKKFMSEEFILNFAFALLVVSFGTISSGLAATFKFISEHPSVLQELTSEHERILEARRNSSDGSLSWDDYKSMTFTSYVINESLRIANIAPLIMRRALKDIEVKGYTIPAGWPVLLLNSAFHLNPEVYKDPLTFNPSRWKDLDSYQISRNFMPFGGGIRQCAGADFTRVTLSIFLHVLVAKYRFTKIKDGGFSRTAAVLPDFGQGVHLKFWPKS